MANVRILASILLFALFIQTAQDDAFLFADSPTSKPVLRSRSLPQVFISALREVKAKSRIPVLLPSQLPPNIAQAKHALVDEAEPKEYKISLYYQIGTGDAGFAAMFAAEPGGGNDAHDIGNTTEVTLSRGIHGYFRAVSCGGSCAPANIWWEEGGVLYQIQVELPSTLKEKKQQQTMSAIANSAIIAGPR